MAYTKEDGGTGRLQPHEEGKGSSKSKDTVISSLVQRSKGVTRRLKLKSKHPATTTTATATYQQHPNPNTTHAQKKKLDEFLNKKIYNLTISTTETSSSSSLGQIHVQHSFDYPIARSRWPSQQTYIRSGSTDESFVIKGSQSDIFFAQEYTLESSSSDTMSTLSTLNHLIPTPRHASCSHLIPTPNEATSASCSFNFDSFGADMFKSVTQTMSQKRQNYSGVNDEESDSSDDDSSFRDYD